MNVLFFAVCVPEPECVCVLWTEKRAATQKKKKKKKGIPAAESGAPVTEW